MEKGMSTKSKFSRISNERGNLELTQQSMVLFFLVVMGMSGVRFLLNDVDDKAQASSNWVDKESAACTGDECVDFEIGNSANRLDPYQ